MTTAPGGAALRQEFRPATDTPRAARRFAREALLSLGLEELLDQVEMLVSELAVNVIFHARTLYTVVLSTPRPGTARVEVHDGTTQPPRHKAVASDDLLSHGRGLDIVEGVANRWGVLRTPGGKCVWAEVDQ